MPLLRRFPCIYYQLFLIVWFIRAGSDFPFTCVYGLRFVEQLTIRRSRWRKRLYDVWWISCCWYQRSCCSCAGGRDSSLRLWTPPSPVFSFFFASNFSILSQLFLRMISPPVLVQSPGSTKLSEAPSNVIKKKKKKLGAIYLFVHVSVYGLYDRACSTLTSNMSCQPGIEINQDEPPSWRSQEMGLFVIFRNYNKKVQGFSISVLSPWSSHVPSVLAWVVSRFSWLGCDIQHFSDYSYRWFHFCQIADKVNYY